MDLLTEQFAISVKVTQAGQLFQIHCSDGKAEGRQEIRFLPNHGQKDHETLIRAQRSKGQMSEVKTKRVKHLGVKV